MQKPMVIRYADEEDTSTDKDLLRVMGIVTRISNRSRKGPGHGKKRKERTSYVDIYYV